MLVTFLRKLMKQRRRLPSQLATDLGITHATVSRWLSSKDMPSLQSCQRLATYSGLPLENVMAIAGHIPMPREDSRTELPEFSDYARRKYPELDDELISVIEYLIQLGRTTVTPVSPYYALYTEVAKKAQSKGNGSKSKTTV